MLLSVSLGLLGFGGCVLLLVILGFTLLTYVLRGGKSTELIRVPDRERHPWQFLFIVLAMSFILLEMTYGGFHLIRTALQK